ncbi:Dabb family protein [Actinacidiphila paucisporea]|uniref:Stress responsive A/B Barrel Domain n=1 Tax=Actinacidiphila paucisporea TaxID=310782 RepID=A0A1M7QP99_9ACTN|nr:Dabb family protein [Actinacidiphila paucisporea]SHN33328.1 Stress responsive A/B Barrel Domain [Actinacidiphila paucisporea]
MIVNVLRFAFRPGTTEQRQAEVLAAMRRTASVEAAEFGTVGRDLGDPAEGFTHAYSVGVADVDAMERYMNDPVHIAGDPEILPYLTRLSAVRFTDDPDPAVGARVAALHQAKLAAYPDLEKLLEEAARGDAEDAPGA